RRGTPNKELFYETSFKSCLGTAPDLVCGCARSLVWRRGEVIQEDHARRNSQCYFDNSHEEAACPSSKQRRFVEQQYFNYDECFGGRDASAPRHDKQCFAERRRKNQRRCLEADCGFGGGKEKPNPSRAED